MRSAIVRNSNVYKPILFFKEEPVRQLDLTGTGEKLATIKQCKMLVARAREAGMKLEFDACKELENGEVDDMLEKIKNYKRPHKKESAEKSEVSEQQINGQRFGMCYKLVLDNVGYKWRDENVEEFIDKVADEYMLATRAEEHLKKALRSV